MQIKTARKALNSLISLRDKLIDIQRAIAPSNADTVMIDAVRSARRNTEAAIARLCSIVPNAEIMHGALLEQMPAKTHNIGMIPWESQTQADSAWCGRCDNAAGSCTCRRVR